MYCKLHSETLAQSRKDCRNHVSLGCSLMQERVQTNREQLATLTRQMSDMQLQQVRSRTNFTSGSRGRTLAKCHWETAVRCSVTCRKHACPHPCPISC